MPSVHDLLLYMSAVIALNLTPGNDMMFVLSSGLSHGRRSGIAASLGIAAGSMLQVVLAGAGLAALVASTPLLFSLIRWAGVFYLLWLAASLLRLSAPQTPPPQTGSCRPAAATLSPVLTVFKQAMWVNLLNPKIIIFVLAFIPQFVEPERGSTFVQFLFLGVLLNLSGTLINGAVGIFAGELRHRLATNHWLLRLRFISALLFIVIAARLAVS